MWKVSFVNVQTISIIIYRSRVRVVCWEENSYEEDDNSVLTYSPRVVPSFREANTQNYTNSEDC